MKKKIDKYVSIDTNRKPEGVIALRLNQKYIANFLMES